MCDAREVAHVRKRVQRDSSLRTSLIREMLRVYRLDRAVITISITFDWPSTLAPSDL